MICESDVFWSFFRISFTYLDKEGGLAIVLLVPGGEIFSKYFEIWFWNLRKKTKQVFFLSYLDVKQEQNDSVNGSTDVMFDTWFKFKDHHRHLYVWCLIPWRSAGWFKLIHSTTVGRTLLNWIRNGILSLCDFVHHYYFVILIQIVMKITWGFLLSISLVEIPSFSRWRTFNQHDSHHRFIIIT